MNYRHQDETLCDGDGRTFETRDSCPICAHNAARQDIENAAGFLRRHARLTGSAQADRLAGELKKIWQEVDSMTWTEVKSEADFYKKACWR